MSDTHPAIPSPSTINHDDDVPSIPASTLCPPFQRSSPPPLMPLGALVNSPSFQLAAEGRSDDHEAVPSNPIRDGAPTPPLCDDDDEDDDDSFDEVDTPRFHSHSHPTHSSILPPHQRSASEGSQVNMLDVRECGDSAAIESPELVVPEDVDVAGMDSDSMDESKSKHECDEDIEGDDPVRSPTIVKHSCKPPNGKEIHDAKSEPATSSPIHIPLSPSSAPPTSDRSSTPTTFLSSPRSPIVFSPKLLALSTPNTNGGLMLGCAPRIAASILTAMPAKNHESNQSQVATNSSKMMNINTISPAAAVPGAQSICQAPLMQPPPLPPRPLWLQERIAAMRSDMPFTRLHLPVSLSVSGSAHHQPPPPRMPAAVALGAQGGNFPTYPSTLFGSTASDHTAVATTPHENASQIIEPFDPCYFAPASCRSKHTCDHTPLILDLNSPTLGDLHQEKKSGGELEPVIDETQRQSLDPDAMRDKMIPISDGMDEKRSSHKTDQRADHGGAHPTSPALNASSSMDSSAPPPLIDPHSPFSTSSCYSTSTTTASLASHALPEMMVGSTVSGSTMHCSSSNIQMYTLHDDRHDNDMDEHEHEHDHELQDEKDEQMEELTRHSDCTSIRLRRASFSRSIQQAMMALDGSDDHIGFFHRASSGSVTASVSEGDMGSRSPKSSTDHMHQTAMKFAHYETSVALVAAAAASPLPEEDEFEML